MAKLRTEKVRGFTTIDNDIFRNKTLSLKAKGLLCLMLSLPDGWNYSIAGLAALSSDGESSIRSALKELKEQGYFYRRQVREKGRIADIEYVICEEPFLVDENLVVEKPQVENQVVENQVVEKQPQLNTNTLNTKELNTNNKDNSPIRDYKDVDKVIEEYNRICKSLPKCMRATKKRRNKIATRLKDYTLDDFIKAFKMSEQSDFLSGRKTEWRASLDWFIQNEDNLAKVLEGRYVETKTGNAEAEGHSSGDSEFYEDLPDVW